MLTILEAQQITQCEETTRGLRDNLLYNINSESMDCLVWEDALVIESHFQHQKAKENLYFKKISACRSLGSR